MFTKAEFPDALTDLTLDIPDRYLTFGDEQGVVECVGQTTTKNTAVIDAPTIYHLSENQQHFFEASLCQPTPDGTRSQHISRFEALQLVLGVSIGEITSSPSIRMGVMLQDIIPREDKRQVADSSYGSESDFNFHNDMSFLPDSQVPDYITLGCIRNLEGAITYVASTDAITDVLAESSLRQLCLAQYGLSHTYHRGTPDEYTQRKQSPVLLPGGEINLGVVMDCESEDGVAALNGLRKLLRDISTPCVLGPGEVLVLPNKKSVHARGTFVMADDPASRRWLQRVSIKARSSEDCH